MQKKGKCQEGFKVHFQNVDQMEVDMMTNAAMKMVLQKTPIGVGIYTSGMLQSYSHGVVTEDYLHCSKRNYQVNHGVVVVGYGQVTDEKVRGHCKEYWIVRNSWGSKWGDKGFFKLCMDGAGSEKTPLGTCLINSYGTWPIMYKYGEPKEEPMPGKNGGGILRPEFNTET